MTLHAVVPVASSCCCVTVDAPIWTFFPAAAAAGCFGPSIGSLVRARWGYVLGSGSRLTTAYAYESVLDEVIFVLGPLIVTVLATKVSPPVGLLSAVLLVVAGTAALVTHRASEPPAGAGHEEGHPSALRSPGLGALMVVMAFVGGVFGGGGDQHGGVRGPGRPARPGRASARLLRRRERGLPGCCSGRSIGRVSARRRLLLGATTMTVTVAALPFIESLGLLAVFLFIAGVGIAPTLISGFSLVERMVPEGTVTEGLTWATTGAGRGPVGGHLDVRAAGRRRWCAARRSRSRPGPACAAWWCAGSRTGGCPADDGS